MAGTTSIELPLRSIPSSSWGWLMATSRPATLGPLPVMVSCDLGNYTGDRVAVAEPLVVVVVVGVVVNAVRSL